MAKLNVKNSDYKLATYAAADDHAKKSKHAVSSGDGWATARCWNCDLRFP